MAGMGVTGILQGLGGFSDSELYGQKPVVPKGLDYGNLIGQATQANISNLPSLTELAGMSTDALTALLERTMPGYTALRDTGTQTLTSWGRGELTPEMNADIQRRAAELGVTLGTTQSQYTGLRGIKLGLDTRLGLQQRALSSGAQWIQQAQNRTFDFTKMFETPEMAIDQGKFNWARDWLAAQVKASPNPQARGAFDTEMGFIGEVLSVYGGGAGYKGTYRPTYGASSPSNGYGQQYGESFFGASQGYPLMNSEGPDEGTGEGGGGGGGFLSSFL